MTYMCRACPYGTYRASEYSPECIPCAPGTTTPYEGATSDSDCMLRMDMNGPPQAYVGSGMCSSSHVIGVVKVYKIHSSVHSYCKTINISFIPVPCPHHLHVHSCFRLSNGKRVCEVVLLQWMSALSSRLLQGWGAPLLPTLSRWFHDHDNGCQVIGSMLTSIGKSTNVCHFCRYVMQAYAKCYDTIIDSNTWLLYDTAIIDCIILYFYSCMGSILSSPDIHNALLISTTGRWLRCWLRTRHSQHVMHGLWNRYLQEQYGSPRLWHLPAHATGWRTCSDVINGCY